MKPKRSLWSTRLGFYFVAIGSACGLGNIWRFPYVVGENGGGAFVLLYITLALSAGLPLLTGELLLGKFTRRSLMNAARKLEGKSLWLLKGVAPVSILLSLSVLAYYAVISGWVLHFLMKFVTGLFANAIHQNEFLSALMSNGLLQVGLASVHLVFVAIVVMRGLQEGVEKWIGNVMPLFVVLLLILVFKSLSMPSSEKALRFLFYPDFSKLNASSLISALGHVFFTLSVGFGTMVTFGSYMHEKEHVPTAGFRVALTDSLISMLAGLLVFPIALQVSPSRLTDPTLIFEALPNFFMASRSDYFFGIAFFLCLYIASLGASIGLFEVVVSNVVDRLPNLGRPKATLGIGAIAFIVATIPAFSSSNLSTVKIFGKGILENIDMLLITWILPIVALCSSLVVSWYLPQSTKVNEFVADDHLNSASLFGAWEWSLRYYVPFLILLGFGLRFLF